jgi:hypothetical protein
MEYIAKSDSFMPDTDANVKTDALNLIRELKDQAKEISLRTLISVCKVRQSNPKDYKEMCEYMLCA